MMCRTFIIDREYFQEVHILAEVLFKRLRV